MFILGTERLLLCLGAVNLTFTALRRLWFDRQAANCAADASRRVPIAAHRVVQRSARAFASRCVTRNDVVPSLMGWHVSRFESAVRCSPACY